MHSLTNKIAVVTGGGKGIGRSIALKYASRGADVAVVDTDVLSAESAVSEILALGRKGIAIRADVSSASDVDQIFDQTIETWGKIDILVNNAGISHPLVSIIDFDLDELEKVIGVNYKGVFMCCRRGGREMARQKSGCIINMASVGGLVPIPSVVYSSMKSAVIMLTKVVARDFARFGVRVNGIAPGFVMTTLVKEYIEKGLSDPSGILDFVPMHTFMEPEDIAQVALFLASEESRLITGSIIVADAGFVSEGGWRAFPNNYAAGKKA